MNTSIGKLDTKNKVIVTAMIVAFIAAVMGGLFLSYERFPMFTIGLVIAGFGYLAGTIHICGKPMTENNLPKREVYRVRMQYTDSDGTLLTLENIRGKKFYVLFQSYPRISVETTRSYVWDGRTFEPYRSVES